MNKHFFIYLKAWSKMEEDKDLQLAEIRLEEDSKVIKEIYGTPNRMWYIGKGKAFIQKKWKPGPKKDRMRINRVRAYKRMYNPVLDIPEIFERIMVYLDHEDPMDAINFTRTLETLGCQENLEAKYLYKKHFEWKYTNRVSLGLLRKKIAHGYHCRRCGKRYEKLNPKKMQSNNTITSKPLCWKCMKMCYKLVTKRKAISIMLTYNASMPMDLINSILGKPAGPACSVGEGGHLRRIKYAHQWYYLKKDVVEARENWKRRHDEELIEIMDGNDACSKHKDCLVHFLAKDEDD